MSDRIYIGNKVGVGADGGCRYPDPPPMAALAHLIRKLPVMFIPILYVDRVEMAVFIRRALKQTTGEQPNFLRIAVLASNTDSPCTGYLIDRRHRDRKRNVRARWLSRRNAWEAAHRC